MFVFMCVVRCTILIDNFFFQMMFLLQGCYNSLLFLNVCESLRVTKCLWLRHQGLVTHTEGIFLGG